MRKSKNPLKKTSIKRTIIFLIILMFAVPLFAQLAMTNISVNNLLRDRIQISESNNVSNVALFVGDIMQSYMDLCKELTRRDSVVQITEQGLKSDIQTRKENHTTLRNIIYKTELSSRYRYPYHYELYVFDGQMYTTNTYTPNAKYEELYKKLSKESWFIKMQNTFAGDAIISTYGDIYSSNYSDRLYFMRSIFGGQNLGFLSVSISVEPVKSAVEKAIIDKGGSAFLFNQKGDMVIQPDSNEISFADFESNLGNLSPFTEEKKYQSIKFHFEEQRMNEDYIVISSPVDVRGYSDKFALVTVIPKKQFMKDADRLLTADIILMLLFTIGVILIVITINKKIIKPIQSLHTLMHSVSEGDYTVRVDNMPANEMKDLGDGFNSMLDTIDHSIEEIRRGEREKHKMEVLLLQEQIKPHFVRNMMNSIIWLANLKGSNGVSRSILALSNLLEYNFRDARLSSSVKEEIEYVKEYVFLQKIRYAHKFEDNYNIDSSLLELEIPKFTFQPIVENAIVHGLLNKNGMGKITISGKAENDCMLFCVSDDGVGIEDSEAQKLLEKGEKTHADLEKIALWNINERIKSRYGNYYGISISSGINCGTCVYIKLPLSVKKEELEQ